MQKALSEKLEIINKLGLHARAAAKFVKAASQFKSDIYLIREGEKVNGKSIMGILMLAAEKGSKITLKVMGNDQVMAFKELKKLIENGFDE